MRISYVLSTKPQKWVNYDLWPQENHDLLQWKLSQVSQIHSVYDSPSHSPATVNHPLSAAVFSTSGPKSLPHWSPIDSQSPCRSQSLDHCTWSVTRRFSGFVIHAPIFCRLPWGPGACFTPFHPQYPAVCLAYGRYSINVCSSYEWVNYSPNAVL